MNRPVVIDLDHSVGPLPGRVMLPMEHWRGALGAGCSLRTLRRFGRVLAADMPADHGTVMLGASRFQHLSLALIERVRARTTFQVLVLDRRADTRRHLFGIHGDSWLRRVALLPQVSHVYVIGISDGGIVRRRVLANDLLPMRRGRLSYWCLGEDARWAARVGVAHAFHAFDDPQALVAEFHASQRQRPLPTYLSIDKSVFAAEVAPSPDAHGRLHLEHATALVDGLAGELVGSDISGEIAETPVERSKTKRLRGYGEPAKDVQRLSAWRTAQHALNLHLLGTIARRSS